MPSNNQAFERARARGCCTAGGYIVHPGDVHIMNGLCRRAAASARDNLANSTYAYFASALLLELEPEVVHFERTRG
jgi:hypothetical protein